MEILKTEGLTFSYPDTSQKAIDDLSLSFTGGELVLIMGRVGSGKSTFLRLIKKEIAPYGTLKGSMDINAERVAYVSQNAENTFVSETVRGELAFGFENECLPNEDIALKIGETASFFNITDILDKKLSQLSGGEKATVAIAAAMLGNADILLLDEPLAQLDPKASAQLVSIIKRVNDELGTTVIIASHISEGIIELCDRVVFFENGRLLKQGSAKELAVNDELLPFYPLFTPLFEERPLTVKEARSCQKRYNEKPLNIFEQSDKDAVIIKNVCFAYGKNMPDVFDALTLNIKQGEVHSIIGANGSGKTTLLKLIANIIKAYSGKVKLNGSCAYVPQNVRYLFTGDKVSDEIREETAKRFLPIEYLERHPYDLSGGEQQLLALAKVSEQGFDILLLDEPTKSIDAFAKKTLSEYISQQRALGKTIVIASHDLDFCAENSDSVSFLSDGCIALSSSSKKVFSSLTLYTTQIRRITRSYLSSAVSTEDLI